MSRSPYTRFYDEMRGVVLKDSGLLPIPAPVLSRSDCAGLMRFIAEEMNLNKDEMIEAWGKRNPEKE